MATEINMNNENSMDMALATITNSPLIPAELKDPFEIFTMFEKNNKFEDLKGRTVKPLAIWYNDEEYADSESGDVMSDTKTYILCEEDGEYNIYSGFSVTMRIKTSLLTKVFKANYPLVKIDKVSRGMKQEYSVEPIRSK